jgi:YfiH family protein
LNNVHPDWIVPDWPAPGNVRAFITTRAGGTSGGPYASFNLGLRTEDDPAAVAANRAALRSLLPQEPVWLRQVHGNRVVDADAWPTAPEVNADAPPATPEADAAIARNPGTVCAVLVADCVPVLLADRAGGSVAVAHAGWRGLAGGVVENTVRGMQCPPAEVLAFLGPGIGPRAFEVGADVREAFVDDDPGAQSAFVPHTPGKWLADLFTLARRRLARAGVSRVFGGGLCTHSDPARFYSHRRNPVTGRMAALIWRAPEKE